MPKDILSFGRVFRILMEFLDSGHMVRLFGLLDSVTDQNGFPINLIKQS